MSRRNRFAACVKNGQTDATRNESADRRHPKFWNQVARAVLMGGLCVASWASVGVPSAQAQEEPTPARPGGPRPDQKFRDFAEVTKGAKKYEGLFTLYEVDDHMYAEVKPGQFNQMYLAPIAIARGMASAGVPLNFGDEWILSFRRVGDKIQLIRKNIYYEAPQGSPLAKAVDQNYTDSVLLALPIVTINPGSQGALIDFSNIFLNDFAGLGLGPMDRNRSRWHKVKAFENNVELEVEATFGSPFGGRAASFPQDGVVDGRGVTLVIHYSLAKRPEPGYRPRFADQRVGHFISATKDFNSSNPDTTFVRRINRWRLEKANPQAALSPPKKQIVWWVENTVPHEYRPYVEEGILEWNKAFEKVGFRNALGVRWQNEQDEFDPEDINYCTFRWIATPRTYAMSGLRADPVTGEMIDGDVIFDASWIRAWKNEYALQIGQIPTANAQTGELVPPTVLQAGEVISPILAARQGFGLPMGKSTFGLPRAEQGEGVWVPAQRSPLQMLLSQRLTNCNHVACEYAAARSQEYSLAAMALAAQAVAAEQNAPPQEGSSGDANHPSSPNSEDKPEGQKDAVVKLPEELIGQAIKEVVMHEVGHSLGLRHNFKASTMLSLDEMHNTDVTRKKGLVGSVMDYNPLNVARKGQKQGDYATTTIGPYDYWAIEYAYKPIQGDEESELKKIASRSPEGDLTYATDEDLYLSNDPLVNAYDLGNDPLRYGKDRIALASELLQTLDSTVVRDGESWARLRQAFSVLIAQYGNAAALAAPYIGGQSFSRDFKGGDKSRDPVTPIPGDKQREALTFLVGEILSDKSFQFSPTLLRRLTTEQWYHWGSDSESILDYNVNDRVLRIQQIVLSHCLSPDVLGRLENQQLMSKPEDKPLAMSEVFRTLTDGIWTEVPKDGKAEKVQCSLIRRNLQRDYLRRLCQIVIGPGRTTSSASFIFILGGGGGSYPADARSLARLHLKELDQRLQQTLESTTIQMDDATRGHLAESRDVVSKVLNAEFEVAQP